MAVSDFFLDQRGVNAEQGREPRAEALLVVDEIFKQNHMHAAFSENGSVSARDIIITENLALAGPAALLIGRDIIGENFVFQPPVVLRVVGSDQILLPAYDEQHVDLLGLRRKIFLQQLRSDNAAAVPLIRHEQSFREDVHFVV